MLTPTALAKLQVGQQVDITWLINGLPAPSNSYSSSVQASAPLAYYQLNETSGTTAADSSGSGLNATYVGGVQLGQPGPIPFVQDTGVTLNGSTGSVQLPTLTNDFTNGFSAEVWAYPTAVANNQAFIDFGNSISDNIQLYRNGTSNDLAFVVYDASSEGTVVVAHNAIALDQWQYFAVTMNASGAVTLYKNGVAIATGTTDIPRHGITRYNNYLGNGNFSQYGNEPYAGGIAEVAIYNQPLSASQVQAHYTMGIPYGTVTINLLQNGQQVQTIATDVTDSENYLWTIPSGLTLTTGYQIQVTANEGTDPSGVSPSSFLIANGGNDFYIAANGNDANSGKDPADPMATLSALLQVYSFVPGDIVNIGAGTYNLSSNILLTAQDSGVTIEGPSSGSAAVFNRGNTNSSSYVVQLQSATNVTLEYLTLTGAVDGVAALSGSASTDLTVSDCTIVGNTTDGIFLDASNDYATLTNNLLNGGAGSSGVAQPNGIVLADDYAVVSGNTVEDHSGTGISISGPTALGATISGNMVFGNGTGIYAQEGSSSTNRDIIANNIVYNNQTAGISVVTYVLVSGNTVYGQTAVNADAILGEGGAEIADNVVYDNYDGIASNESGLNVHNNRLYDNSNVAIAMGQPGTIVNNDVYSNGIGIQAYAAFSGFIEDNIVYANTTDGILVQDSSASRAPTDIINNTVYEIVGTAIMLNSGSYNNQVFNNILCVQAGFDIYVADNSQVSFTSDYNLLYTGTASNADVGFWNSSVNGGICNTLSAWQAASGKDAHSINSNPDFVNIAGDDGELGYTQVNGVYADYGVDDNFSLSAGSPAIDRGDSWVAPLTDIQGSPRVDDPGTPNQGSSAYFSAYVSPAPAYPTGGTAEGWEGSNTYYNYTLPFAFTFYGITYSSVSVSTAGLLQFAGSDSPAAINNVPTELLNDARIDPMLGALSTSQTGDNIFVNTSVAGEVTIRWVATNTVNNSQDNFAVTLFNNGDIQFYYGAGNTDLTPTVGISAGNGIAYQLLAGYSGQTTLTNATSVLYTLQPGFVDLGAYEFQGSSVDTTPPAVASVTPTLIGSGGTGFTYTQLQVTFTEPVNSIDADSTAVYELRKAGSNGFGSINDVIYGLTPVYNPNTNTVTLLINGLGSGSLPAGTYRFTIFSTATDTIHDLSGNALDGDGNGVAGGNFVRVFTLVGAQPTVSGVTPSSGLATGGTTVTITGTNLTAVTAVDFGTQSVPVLTDNGTSLTVVSPAGTPGAVAISLTTAAGTVGTSVVDQFTYVAVPPTITLNNTEIFGNTILTIQGTGFSTTPGSDSVLFNLGVKGTVTAATSTTLTVSLTIPSILSAGTILDASVIVGGVSSVNPVEVATVAFGVSSVTATPSGVVLTFNAPIDPNTTVLYSSPGDTTLGAADVTIVGATTGPVRGSLVIDPTDPYIATFLQTSGLLVPDTYTVKVTSAVKAVGGYQLASNYTATLTVATTTTPILSLPSFARGPGQTVALTDSLNNTTGIPINISNATNVTQVGFSLTYDPQLLTIAGSGALSLASAATAAGLVIQGYIITSVDANHSILNVSISGGAGFTPINGAPLVTILASVPTTAPYLDKEVLNLNSVQVNGANATGVSSVSVVAYPGDVLGTGLPDATDASLVDQVASGSGTGFSKFKDLDPVIIGGVGSGLLLNANDASLIDEAASGATVSQIPSIPIGVSLTFGGPDPYLYLSAVQGAPGQTVTETLYLDVTNPNGIQLTALDEAIGFDASALQISDVRGTSALAALGSYETASTVDNGSGVLLVGQAFMGTGLPPVVPYGTDIPVLQFNVTLNADMGVGSESGLTLLQYGTVNSVTQYTAVSDNEGALTWTPGMAPSNSGNAAIDGSVTVVPASASVVPAVVASVTSRPVVVQPKVVEPVRRVVPVTAASQPVATTLRLVRA